MPPRRLFAFAVAAIAAAGLLAACSAAPEPVARNASGRHLPDPSAASFYAIGPVAPAPAGTVVRRERIPGPPHSRAWRVLYHSRDRQGRDIVVSGAVIEPDAAPPPGGRTVVSWAHPTTGVAPDCAPSRTLGIGSLIPGVKTLLAAGDVIAAADYPGLGVAGASSYLLGEAEGRSVLDAARAARQIVGSAASDELLLWGHSQGGQAALFAAQEVTSYAPELHLRAVAVAAPASDLAALLRDHLDDVSGVTIGSYAFSAYASAYEVPLSSVLTPAGIAATPSMTRLCLLSQSGAIHGIARPLIGGYAAVDPGSVEPWKDLLAQNSPGGARIGVPIFVAQGLSDRLVDPAVTTTFVQHLCADGERVRYVRLALVDHGLVGLVAAGRVTNWFRSVLSGSPPTSSC